MMTTGFASLINYRPIKSPFHNMDARVKFFLLILFLVVVFLPYGNPKESLYPYATAMAIDGSLLLICLVGCFLAKIRFSQFFSSIKTMWFFLILILGINIFFYVPGSDWANTAVLGYVGNWPIYEAAVFFAGYVFLRIVLTLLGSLLLISTTKPLDISYAVEWYCKPLDLVKFPSGALGMMVSLALRFIPVLAQEAERIQKAQASRGLDPTNGNFKTRFKSLISLFIPLLVISFMDAITLSEAMELRGYDPRAKRTRYRTHPFRPADWGWVITGLIMLSLALTAMFIMPGGQPVDFFRSALQ